MKKFLLTLIVTLALSGSIFAQHPESHWSFNYHDFDLQAGLYASLMINGVPVDTEYEGWDQMEVAAFVGDELRMSGMYLTDEYVIEYGELFPTLDLEPIYYNNPGDVVTFKMYNHITGVEYGQCEIFIYDDGTEVEILTGEDHMEGIDDPDHPLMLNFIGEEPVIYTFEKEIIGYGENTDDFTGYYFIASPINNVDPATVDYMTNDFGYDLFAFDQESEGEEWQNYKLNPEEFRLEVGKGYLYANKVDVNLTVTGTPAEGEVFEVTLQKTENKPWMGWNLVGNPFGVKAYIDRPCYTLNGDGYVTIDANEPIGVMQGVLVQAADDGEVMAFTPASSKSANLSLNLTCESKFVDRAIVNFDNRHNLNKITFRENDSKLYMTQDNKDYAVVYSEGQGVMPVGFKAKNNGSYTISFSAENAEFSYLHLIDNLTGNDVNLLENPSYSFDALTSDYASRFKLVFSTGDASMGNDFGFISDGNIIIPGNTTGTVQVIDALGRILVNENGVNSVSTTGMASGVYVLRLVNGNDAKTQKIVVK